MVKNYSGPNPPPNYYIPETPIADELALKTCVNCGHALIDHAGPLTVGRVCQWPTCHCPEAVARFRQRTEVPK